MHQDRNSFLASKTTVQERESIHDAALSAHSTQAEVVDALVGRRPVAEAVLLAAEALAARYPGLGSKLVGWPYECAFCKALLKAAPLPCAHCSRTGCIDCVPGQGCPPCQEETAARIEKERAARLRSAPIIEAVHPPFEPLLPVEPNDSEPDERAEETVDGT